VIAEALLIPSRWQANGAQLSPAQRMKSCQEVLSRIADLLRGAEQMFVIKMSIAGRRLVVGMAKQPSDHGQGFLVHAAWLAKVSR